MLRNFLDSGIDPNFASGLLSEINAMQYPRQVPAPMSQALPHVAATQARDQTSAQMVNAAVNGSPTQVGQPIAPPMNQSQPQIPQAASIAPQAESTPAESPGLLSQIFTPQNMSMLGAGLLAKSQGNPNVVASAMQAGEAYKQKAALDSFSKAIQTSPMLKSPEQREIFKSLIATGDPKAIEYALKAITPPADYNIGKGETRFSGATNQEIAHGTAPEGTTLEQNLKAAGYVPGTPEYQKAVKDYMSGNSKGYSGAGLKALTALKSQVGAELGLKDQDKIDEAASAYLNGETSLKDGTVLPPPSGITKNLIDQVTKAGSTAALINQGVKANQAEIELDVLSKFAIKNLKPYGTTYLNMSPQQVSDSFKSDKESQKRLGRFIAAQQIQYEIAQNEIKLAMGQPGVTSTQELMQLGQQMIKTSYPKLSFEAREESQRAFREALSAGLAARNKYGIRASSATGQHNINEGALSSELKQHADEAITAGADPKLVNERLAQMIAQQGG